MDLVYTKYKLWGIGVGVDSVGRVEGCEVTALVLVGVPSSVPL